MKDNSTRLSADTSRRMTVSALSIMIGALLFVALWGFGKLDFTKIDATTPIGMAHKLACCGGVAVLMGILVYVMATEFMRDKDQPTMERPNWFYPLMSGLLSLGSMFVAYSFLGMWPMGEKTGMVVDMHHQYAPLLSGLRDGILNGELGLYSFEVGMGANYLSLFGYYLASPLNLLLLLFPEHLLAEGILVITLIKNALCGAMFALCVQTVFRHKSLCVPMVAVMYSLMMYLLAYSWNIMWLDVVMVLPLVILGFERLMNTGKYLTYVLSLAYCLYANYYIGFMLCVFLVLYYITYAVRTAREGEALALSFGRFAGFSVLAAGLVAFLLIPTYLALQGTSAAGAKLPDVTSSRDFFELIGRHLAGTTPTIRSGNLPNMYCGVLTALCIPLFALNSGIPRRRRMAFMAFWMIMSFSFLINLTDLTWHGFHAPNDLPYRFSFLYSFLILFMAFEVLMNIKHIQTKHVFAVFAGAVAYLVLEERFGADAYTFQVIYLNFALVALYTVILAVASSKKARRNVAYGLLLLCVTAEMAIGAGDTISTVNSNEYFTKHENYVDNDISKAISLAVKKAQSYGDNKAQGDFYRMEFLPRRTCVDTALFHYRGITNFSSSNYYTTTKLMGGLGYAINGVNSHLYKSFVPFTDSLLGIRYVVLNTKLTSHAQLKLLETVSYGTETYYVYENIDALGLGYVTDPAIKNYTYTQYNPMASQNNFFGALTGMSEKDLYVLYDVELDGDGGEGSTSYSSTGFQVNPENGSGTGRFSVTVQQDGQLFLYADCSAADSMRISSGNNSWDVTPHEPFIIDGGYVVAGTTVTLSVNTDSVCTGNFYVATLDTDLYRAGMDKLAAGQLKVSSFDNRHVRGTINAASAGVLTTSIPYDKGWQVKVDGETVKTYGINNALLAFDIAAGQHTVEMTYVPQGLLPGLCVSALALVVLIALLVLPRLRKTRVAPMEECLDYTNALPVQEDFAVISEPVLNPPVLPDTLEELTGIYPSNAATDVEQKKAPTSDADQTTPPSENV